MHYKTAKQRLVNPRPKMVMHLQVLIQETLLSKGTYSLTGALKLFGGKGPLTGEIFNDTAFIYHL